MTHRLVRCPTYLVAILCFLSATTIDAADIIVTNVEQNIASTGGCSLEEAIYAANFFESKAIHGYDLLGNPVFIPTQCTPSTGNDTIILPTQALFLMKHIVDDVDNVAGPTATPIITSTITIIANGSTFQRLSADNFRLFAVGDRGSLAIQEAYIKGFQTKGGDGGRGGGGGLGAGGAIYVKLGTLNVESYLRWESSGRRQWQLTWGDSYRRRRWWRAFRQWQPCARCHCFRWRWRRRLTRQWLPRLLGHRRLRWGRRRNAGNRQHGRRSGCPRACLLGLGG
jgi:hypothetical protein